MKFWIAVGGRRAWKKRVGGGDGVNHSFFSLVPFFRVYTVEKL